MENTELNAFQWDDAVQEMDFFGTTVTNPNKDESANKAEIKAPEKEGVTKIDPEDKDVPEVDFFGESNKGGDSELINNDEDDDNDKEQNNSTSKNPKTKIKNSEDKEEDTSKVSISNTGVANFLKEKGFIDFELEEGDELDEAGAEQLIEDAFDESVETRLEQTIANLPDSVKNLVKFAAKGGDVDEYLANVSKTSSQGLSKNLDMTKEANQEKFMRYKLAQEGNDEEYIDFQIETMKDSGKLESLSTKAFEPWKKKEEEKDAELVKGQSQKIQQAKQNALNFKRDITKHVGEIGEINGLKFTRQDTKELPDYITSATETLEDGRQISPFYKELGEALRDKDKILVVAKLLKSNFNFKDIEKAATTKVTQNVKQNIQRQQNNKDLGSTAGGSSQTKRLADYFND